MNEDKNTIMEESTEEAQKSSEQPEVETSKHKSRWYIWAALAAVIIVLILLLTRCGKAGNEKNPERSDEESKTSIETEAETDVKQETETSEIAEDSMRTDTSKQEQSFERKAQEPSNDKEKAKSGEKKSAANDKSDESKSLEESEDSETIGESYSSSSESQESTDSQSTSTESSTSEGATSNDELGVTGGDPNHDHSFNYTVTHYMNCWTDGFTMHMCSCGAYYVDGVVPAHHIWDEGTILIPSSATTEGEILYTCTACGKQQIEPLPIDTSHVHTYTETVVPPTCNTDGYTTHTCSCGDTYTDAVIPAFGHSMGPEIDPFGDGTVFYNECSVCGATITRIARGHMQEFWWVEYYDIEGNFAGYQEFNSNEEAAQFAYDVVAYDNNVGGSRYGNDFRNVIDYWDTIYSDDY